MSSVRSSERPPLAPRRGISALVRTYNEEQNIRAVVASLKLLSDDVWVLDSGSTDRTAEIARELGAQVAVNPWPGYAEQWNWGFANIPFRHEYLVIADADEVLPEAWCRELRDVLDSSSPPDLVLTRWRLWWMGRPVEHGNYGLAYVVRAGRRASLHFEVRACNEHVPLAGTVYQMKARYDHHDAKRLDEWFAKHLRYARFEAEERLRSKGATQAEGPRLWGAGQASRKRWLREKVYDRIPLALRPWAYFTYRYGLGRGWRDGLTGTWFHVLHGLWFPMLIDVYERDLSDASGGAPRG